jgi:hypothetical protein
MNSMVVIQQIDEMLVEGGLGGSLRLHREPDQLLEGQYLSLSRATACDATHPSDLELAAESLHACGESAQGSSIPRYQTRRFVPTLLFPKHF